MSIELEHLICGSIEFDPPPSPGRWGSCFCEVCGDGTHTKGRRGGWLFDQDKASYNCFNCGIKGSIDLNSDYVLTKNMWTILKAFSISPDEIKLLALQANPDSNLAKAKRAPKINVLSEIPIPDYFTPLLDADFKVNKIARKALKYLDGNALSPYDYQYFLSTGVSNSPVHKIEAKKMIGRLIVPVFHNNGLIYYTARDLTGKSIKKYLSCSRPTDMLFNSDELDKSSNFPLFVCESFSDALHLNGCATFTNAINATQLGLLRQCRRRKILVPDFNNDYNSLLDAFAKEGWDSSMPSLGSCKDVSEAIKRYGRLYTLNEINKSIKPANTVKILYGLNSN